MDKHADSYAFAKGEASPEESTHLEKCQECRRTIEETESVLSLLQDLPEIEPSPEVWTRIESRIAPVSRPRRFAIGWPVAVAASFLVSLLSVMMLFTRPADRLAATVSSVSPGTDVMPGTRINVGDTFHSPSFATLTLPDSGILRLNRDTRIRFDDRRKVTLLQGELFAEIIPSAKGFEVISGLSTVTVHGTKFGVRHGDSVYVVEGSVSVAGPSGRVLLSSSEMASLLPERLPSASLEGRWSWVRSMDKPTLALKVTPRSPSVVRAGQPFEIDLVFSADAPLWVEDPRRSQNLVVVLVKTPSGRAYSMNLDPSQPRSSRVDSSNGRMLLDVDKEAVLTFLLEPGFFQDKGIHTLSIAYFAPGTHREAVSETFHVEVRP